MSDRVVVHHSVLVCGHRGMFSIFDAHGDLQVSVEALHDSSCVYLLAIGSIFAVLRTSCLIALVESKVEGRTEVAQVVVIALATVLDLVHVDGAERLRAIESTLQGGVVVASWAGQEVGFLVFFKHVEGLHCMCFLLFC